RTVAEPLDRKQLRSSAVQRFIDDMVETMRDYDGVGLAAPQVHEAVRIVVYEVAVERPSRGTKVPLTVLVNPVLTPLTGERVEDWEGCLSVPDLRGKVPRYTSVRIDAQDRDGEPVSYPAAGFHARVVQHECDHLDGKVYLDRMTDLSTLTFLPEFLRFAG